MNTLHTVALRKDPSAMLREQPGSVALYSFMFVYMHFSLNGQRSVELLIHQHLCCLWPLQMNVHLTQG